MAITPTVKMPNAEIFRKALEKRYSPYEQQERTLQRLLLRAGKTAFGQHYDFGHLARLHKPARVFQELVPVVNYEHHFANWWHRTLDGEPNVCWPGFTNYFALSSGTTNASTKYIPVTADMTRSMRTTAFRMFSCLPKYKLPGSIYAKDWLMVGGSATLQRLPSGAFAGDLSGINARKPPFWVKAYYKPGTEVARLTSWDERVKAISAMAPSWDVGIMTGIPSWITLTLEHIVHDHGLGSIHDIWPNLQVFVSGGIALEPYKPSLEQLVGRPLIYQDSYLASEGFIAYQNRPDTQAMRLALNSGIFFEFIPFKDDYFDEEGQLLPSSPVLTLRDVEMGVDYALAISTTAGAWRYLIGDTVRFTDLNRSEIIITGRTKHFLSLCGEHLSVDNMNKALQEVCRQFDMVVPEFTVGGIRHGRHFEHHWYLAADAHSTDTKAVAVALDAALKHVNDDYAAERGAMLQKPVVHFVSKSTFLDWQSHHGKINGQSKIPRVMKGQQWEQWRSFADQ